MRACVHTSSRFRRLDIVLREIAEGKIIAEVDFDAMARSQEKKDKRAKWLE